MVQYLMIGVEIGRPAGWKQKYVVSSYDATKSAKSEPTSFGR